MSYRAVILSLFVTAAVAVSITAGVLLAFGGSQEAASAPVLTSAHGDVSPTLTAAPQQDADPSPATSFAALTRPAVDWAAVYERAVPSLVSVSTDSGVGSGFFVSDDGHIITNWHVVSGATRLQITLQSSERVEADFVAKDAGNDLALLQIDADDLDSDDIVVPVFGPLDELRIGDPVGALGTPFSLPNSLSVGVISAFGRLRPSGSETWEPLRNMIQTDAALNPGNSGGMLVDDRGRVIGIPTQIEAAGGVNNGIGFAVSADTLLRSLPTMLQGDDVERAYLGVSLSDTEDGLVVGDVVCGSAADAANLRTGDVIVRVNDEPIESFDDLVATMAEILPGDEVAILIDRGARRVALEATVTAWPSEAQRYGCG